MKRGSFARRGSLFGAVAALALSSAATAQSPGVTSAASCVPSERVLPVDAAAGPLHLGLASYPQTLQLADHEVVLTFDDGPSPETTPIVLDALHAQCIHATFFLIGRNAKAHPSLVRREIADGETVGHHSNTHPAFTLRGFDERSGEADIDAGIAAVEQAGYGADARPAAHPHVPFFRFPGFADTPGLLDMLDRRHVAVFGTDLWAGDWMPMTPDEEHARVMAALERAPHHSGIILFHDTRHSTVEALPGLLRDLREKGYRIVHLVPRGTGRLPALAHAGPDWVSKTQKVIEHLQHPIVAGAHHAAAAIGPAPIPPADPPPGGHRDAVTRATAPAPGSAAATTTTPSRVPQR